MSQRDPTFGNSQLESTNQLLHSLNSFGLGCDLLTIRSGFATWSSLQFHSFVDKNGVFQVEKIGPGTG